MNKIDFFFMPGQQYTKPCEDSENPERVNNDQGLSLYQELFQMFGLCELLESYITALERWKSCVVDEDVSKRLRSLHSYVGPSPKQPGSRARRFAGIASVHVELGSKGHLTE